jgi:glycosyltransferase involved in cell wall biosynthesis
LVSSAIDIVRGKRTLAESRPRMRVLLIHNRYRTEGGEERAVRDIAELLSRRGHAVDVMERSSAELGRAGAARGLLAGGLDPAEVGVAVRRFRADVAHVHNLHPSFGWRALAAARAAGARTVLHLHNFRLFCAIAIAYRDGGPCFRCRGANTLPGLRLRCRGSLLEAAAYAAGLHRQQARVFAHVDRFVVVSAATAARLVELGLPRERTVTLANFVPASSFSAESHAGDGRHALIAGRLVEEKGFATAIAAAVAARVPLVVAGEGPHERALRELAGTASVSFTGRIDAGALAEIRSQAAVALVPSRWEEPCPYAALEALAAGVPVLASDRGGLPEIVGADAVLPAEAPAEWAAALAQLWADPALRRSRGERALSRARERFGEDRFYEGLMQAYGER